MQNRNSWTSPCSDTQKRTASAIAERIAIKIGDATELAASNKLLRKFCPDSLERSFFSILFAALDDLRPGNGYRNLAHRNLALALQENSVLDSIACFGGLSQLGIATSYVESRYKQYGDVLAAIDQTIANEGLQRARKVRKDASIGDLRVDDYDLVSGLSGVTAYLLSRRDASANNLAAAEELVGSLVYLASERENNIPRFAVAEKHMKKYLGQGFGKQSINCGLAHGFPGIAAVLSLALQSGIDTERVKHSLHTLVRWLISSAQYDELGPAWTAGLPVPLELPIPRLCSSTAWCYGSIGVSRAICVTGIALKDQSLIDFALTAVKTAILQRADINSSELPLGICHGLAGVLLVLLRFFHDTKDQELIEPIGRLVDNISSRCDVRSSSSEQTLGVPASSDNDATFLTGSAGVALALIAVSSDLEPTWDRILAIS